MVSKNQTFEITIENLCGNGNGISHLPDGMVVFIPNCAQADKLIIKIIKVTRSYAVGIIDKMITPSETRVDDGCKFASKCGGCIFQHIGYQYESEYKKNLITDAFSHIAGLSLQLSEFHSAKNINGYRNKSIYPIAKAKDGRLICGFYAQQSHRIVEHDICLIGDKAFSDIKDSVMSFLNSRNSSAYDEETGKGLLRALYIRKNNAREMLLSLVLNGNTLSDFKTENDFCDYISERHSNVVGILINRNTEKGNAVLGKSWRLLFGKDVITDTICEKHFRITPASFHQVNHDQTEVLYGIAKKYADIKSGERILDLYCGTGTIGIILSEKGTHLTGVEISPEAVEDAKHNAQQNGIDADFICLDADEALNSERVKNTNPDVIILDPPRKGCGESAVAKISSLSAKRIVYVSCNPATLARDLEFFIRCGYRPVSAAGVDMFPRTGHVETVVLITRKEK